VDAGGPLRCLDDRHRPPPQLPVGNIETLAGIPREWER
jgi:hypothetical protein